MALIGGGANTLIDLASNLDKNGQPVKIIEMLTNAHEVVNDMLWIEGNQTTGHKVTSRTTIPSASFRQFNAGVGLVKTTEAPQSFDTAMLEAYMLTDKDLAQLQNSVAAFRLSRSRGIMEGITQQFATQLFYGTVAGTPGGFLGLSSYYPTITVSAAVPQAVNVIDAGGTASANTSIYLVGWREDTVAGIYPKGFAPGLQHEDVTTIAPVTDANGLRYQAYQDKYSWKCGLAVMDWRYVVRGCNIDTTTNAGGLQSTTPPNLYRLMTRMVNKIPNLSGVNAVPDPITGTGGNYKMSFYVNRAVKTWAAIQAMEKTTMAFTNTKDAQGNPQTEFWGIPIKLCDQLLSTETRVV